MMDQFLWATWINLILTNTELNPAEEIWNWLKKVELKNRCFSDRGSLKKGVIEASEELIEREDVRRGCVAEWEYITS